MPRVNIYLSRKVSKGANIMTNCWPLGLILIPFFLFGEYYLWVMASITAIGPLILLTVLIGLSGALGIWCFQDD